MSKKELTELQKRFLDFLFSEESGGDPHVAKRLAGYGEGTRTSEIIQSLGEEIVDLTIKSVAASAPKAYFSILKVLEDGSMAGAANKLKAAIELLNRAGVKERENPEDRLNIPKGGIVILPAKEYSNLLQKNDEEDEELEDENRV